MHAASEAGDCLIRPRDLALAYDRVVSAHWRGEHESAAAIGTWFEAHWSESAPPEPDDPPEGTSVLGGAGSGIRWYTHDEAVLGYVSRRVDGCYRVRISEAVPPFLASWDVLEQEARRQPDDDHLLRHRGANPATTRSSKGQRQPIARQQRVQGLVPDEEVIRAPVAANAAERRARGHDDMTTAHAEEVVAVHMLEETDGGEPAGVPTKH